MKFKYIIYILIATFSILSCNSDSSSESEFAIEGQTEDGFEDGTYCAEVTYDNPNTGTSNTYTLEVEVQYNQVTQINWGNGGWMDEDHFSAVDLDENGYCSFSSDKGYDYTVQIIGRDCGSTDESSFESDVQEDEEDVTCPECGGEKYDSEEYCSDCQESMTCPKCGGEKYAYDTYCQSCTSRIEDVEENTCSRCGGFQYYVYGGLCDDCERQDEEEDY